VTLVHHPNPGLLRTLLNLEISLSSHPLGSLSLSQTQAGSVSLIHPNRRRCCIWLTMDCGPPIVSLNTNKLLIIIPVWYRVPRLRVLFQVLSLSHTPTPVVNAIRKYFSSHTLHVQDIRAPKGRPRMNKKQRPS